MKKAFGYSRYSSASQSDGSTIQTQQEAIENYCFNHDIQLIKHYSDLAISGKDAEHRKQFLQMIHDAVLNKIDYIIVYTRDRFSRSVKDFVKYIQILNDSNCSLICVSENLDNSTASGKLSEWVMISLAQYYIENLSREALRGLRYNAEHGIWNNYPPTGYNRDKKTGELVINEEEAFLVKRVFDVYLKTKSARETFEIVTKENFVKKNGKPISYAGVCYMLRNRVYIGEYKYKIKSGNNPETIVIPDVIPKLITLNKFNKVQEILDSRYKKLHSRDSEFRGMLDKKVICGYTNNKFYKCLVKTKDSLNVSTYVYFVHRKFKNKRYAKSIASNLLEDFIILLVTKVILGKRNEKQIINFLMMYAKNSKEYYIEQDLKARTDINELKQKLSNYIQEISEEDNDIQLLLDNIKRTQIEINTMESIITINKPIINDFQNYVSRDIVFNLHNISDQLLVEKKKTINKILDSIVIYDEFIRVKFNANIFIPVLKSGEFIPKNIFYTDILRSDIEKISKGILYKEIEFKDLNFRRLLE